MKYPKSIKAFKAFFFCLAIVCCLLVQGASVSAQPARIKHVITKVQKDPNQYLGRDLWFTMAQNYQNQGGKYYNLYVTSPNNTSVFIQVTGGSTSKWPITAGQILTFTVPLGWEVTTSGVVEPKGIRVWSNDADLTAYLLSRNPATSDGMLIIPTIGWGTEYVVAAYGSLFEGYGSFVYDYPSEFSIVANQNGTICTITPNVDLRCENGTTLVHKAHVQFNEILNRGECVQYQAMIAQNCDDYDVTGSVVTSNNPVGIVGASQCPNIPCETPYCDHVCDMIPPIRTWANTYQTIPFDTRIAGDTYLIVASKDGQTIYRNGQQYAILPTKYSYYFRPDVQDPAIWTSDAPFMLVQYINSTTFEANNGGSNAGRGDPAMVVVNAVEQYTPRVIFQTPNIQGSGGFSNYANVMVLTSAITSTTFDGKPINSAKGATRAVIPGSLYTGFRIAQVAPGKHELVSTAGLGVYVYGYGSYDSYAWAGSLGIKTFNDPDTIPPTAVPTGVCYDAHVDVTDNHKLPPASRIAEMTTDSLYNMAFNPDPVYQIGIAADQSFYDMNVIDNTKEAYLKVHVHDFAGNLTTIVSTYIPQSVALTPAVNNYGSGQVGISTSKYFTFTNTGTIPYDWQNIKLLLGNQGFVIDSGLAPNTPIPVGGKRIVRVSFTPTDPALKSDTIQLSDGCNILTAIVLGTGGQPDFTVSDEDFQCQLVGTTTKLSDAIIVNLSKGNITIDSIYIDNVTDFSYNKNVPGTNKFTFTVPGNSQHKIEFGFSPTAQQPYATTAHFHSAEIGWKTATLKGSGCAPSAHITRDTLKVSECGTAVPFLFAVKSDGSSEVNIVKVELDAAGDPNFKFATPAFTDQSNNAITLPRALSIGDQFFVNVIYNPAAASSGTVSTRVYAISDKGDTTLPMVTASVQNINRILDPTKPAANIPAAPFGSPVKTDILTYCNKLTDPVTINGVLPVPGPYNSSFKITGYNVGGTAKTLPITLAANECVDITVQFDPSASPDPVQTQNYTLSTDGCINYIAGVATCGTTLGPPTILGGNVPTILSCGSKDVDVVITNPNFSNAPAMTIKNITVTGTNPTNFITGAPSANTVGGGKSVTIPVTFAPPATSGPNAANYTANVVVTLTNSSGVDTTMTAVVTGSANGMSAVVSSNFTVQSAAALETTTLPLPINVAFNRNGLADQIDAFGITKITLNYTYNTDLLDATMNGTAPVVTNLPSGWTSTGSVTTPVGSSTGVMTVVLSGTTQLTDAQATAGVLGNLSFTPKVTKDGTKATSVALAPPTFETAAGTPVGGCLSIAQTGTQFTLVYECGDSTLSYFLTNGKAPSMIKPVSPNPVSASNGGSVNFQYVTRHAGVVSLIVYDELGKEVTRVVDNQFHPAGTYEVRADASRFTSGSYVYRFTLDNGHAISGRLVVNN